MESAITTSFDLSGQVAVVTGGAAGIGEAIVHRLAAAGARVAIADLDPESASHLAAQVIGAIAVAVDVADAASVDDAFIRIRAELGPVNILVNNAGIAGKAAPLEQQSDEDWARMIAINLMGVVHCTRAVLPSMRERRYGRIVNLASIAGKEGNPNMTPYSATKAAVIGFTKSVAKEVATAGICINAISPAVVHTKILDTLTEDQVDYMTARIPMRRPGKPDEIAAVAQFLSSRECSFVTGQCYDASGGRATY